MIAFDDEVDRRYFQIEEGIRLVLTTERLDPADVRLVLALLHINLHFERIADYCVTMAKLTKLVAGLRADKTLFEAVKIPSCTSGACA